MKRRWKIALGVSGALAVIGAGGFAWMLTQPPRAAELVEAGPGGQRIDAQGILGNYYPGKGEGPRPAILLLGGSDGGLSEDVRAAALLLQAQGFSALQLAYHNAPGKSAQLVNIPLEDFYRALDWLKRQPGVDPGRLAIMGYSKGAEAAALVTTRYPGIRAAVLGMPSSVVWDGMTGENYLLGSFSSSWSEGGRPVAHLEYKGRPAGNSLLPIFVAGLAALNENPEAIIPIERFKGRVLLVCGEKDGLWPSCPMADQIVARAQAKQGPAVTVLRYPDAGHGVAGAPFTDSARAAKWAKLGGSAAGNSEARRDSWDKGVAFLAAATQ